MVSREVGLNLAQGALCKTTCGQEFGGFLAVSSLVPSQRDVLARSHAGLSPGERPQQMLVLGFSSVQLCCCGTAPFGRLPFLTWGTDPGVASMAHSVLSLLTPAAQN